MDNEKDISWLTELCKDKAWFHKVGLGKHGRLTVYTHYIDRDVESFIPPLTPEGRQVLCHFTSDDTLKLETFVTVPVKFPILSQFLVTKTAKETVEDPETDLAYLTAQLDKLEKECGSEKLGHIFFEVHDQSNAVTDFSREFIDVRNSLEKLYNQFGFDVIYDELDG